MSRLNTFANQLAGRVAAQPGAQQGGQPQQAEQTRGWDGQGQNQAQWNPALAPQQGYAPQQNYSQPNFTPAFQPMNAIPEQTPMQAQAQPQRGYAPTHDPYAQQRSQAAQQQPQYQPPYQQQPQSTYQPQQTWQQQPDPRGFDIGSYMTPAQTAAAQAAQQYRSNGYQQPAEYEQNAPDWNQAQGQGQDMGFAQPAGGELDPNYGEEQQEFEAEDAPRGRRGLMIAAALVGAIVVGGGLAYGYKSVFGGRSGEIPPVIKSAEGPSKAKPADAGGKQFAHTDSKIMGRLGDGNAAPPPGDNTASPASGDVDANGTRKVQTVAVNRDGTIQPSPVTEPQAAPEPPAAAPPPPAAVASNEAPAVPGLTVVDAFANSRPQSAAAQVAAAAPPAARPAEAAAAVAPPKAAAAAPPKPIKIAKIAKAEPVPAAAAVPAQTGSVDQNGAAPVQPAPVKKAKKDKAAVAALSPSATTNSVATTGSGSNGFVAVLASVPRSNSSRIDALKRFADMQQKYGSVLAGKTPDVAEANLGAKGAFHRLVVGPPGSREQASNVCSQLKSQGYGDCWVTSY